MAYSTSNPPTLVSSAVGGGPRLWMYKSTDAATAVRVSGYFTNGYALGMRANDILIMIDTDASPIASQIMIVNAASSSAVDCSDGVAITATDTD